MSKQRLRVRVRVVDDVPCVCLPNGSFEPLKQYVQSTVPALRRAAQQ